MTSGYATVHGCIGVNFQDGDQDGDVDIVSLWSSFTVGEAIDGIVYSRNNLPAEFHVRFPTMQEVVYMGAQSLLSVYDAVFVVSDANGHIDFVIDVRGRGLAMNSLSMVSRFGHFQRGLYLGGFTAAPGDDDWAWTGLHLVGDLVNSVGQIVDVTTSLYLEAAWSAAPPGTSGLHGARLLAFCDINGDGLADAVSAPTANGVAPASVFLQALPGTFVRGSFGVPGFPATSATSGSDVRAVEWLDVDGDGDFDLLMLVAGLGSVLLSNRGLAGFVDETQLRGLLYLSPQFALTGVAIFDADGDQDLDLVTTSVFLGARLLENNGTGFFTDRTEAWFPDLASRYGDTPSVVAADLNGDGMVDVVLGGSGTGVALRLLLNTGRGSFTMADSSVVPLGAPHVAMVAGDFCGDDSLPDVFVCSAGPNRAYCSRDLARGVLFDVAATLDVADRGANCMGAALEDVNLDGRTDIVVANTLPAVHRLYVGRGAPGTGSPGAGPSRFVDEGVQLNGTAVPGAPATLDVDQDGDLDLPGWRVTNPRMTSRAAPGRAVVVRVVGRRGAQTQAGASVTLVHRQGLLPNVTKVVSTCRDLTFGVGNTSASFDVVVVFVGGRQSVVTGIVPAARFVAQGFHPLVVADVPTVAEVRFEAMVPGASQAVGIGSVLLVVVEVYAPAIAVSATSSVDVHVVTATVNGRDVAPSFTALFGNASTPLHRRYSLSYIVQPGDTRAEAAVVVRYPGSPFGSPPATASLGSGPGLIVDGVPPGVAVGTGGSLVNDSAATEATQSLVLVCDPAVSVEVRPCVVQFSVGGAPMASAPSGALLTLGPFPHGSNLVLVARGVDSAGNVGPPITLVWEVDLQSPTSVFLARPPPYTSSRSAEFAFGCNDLGCRFLYRLNRGAWLLLGAPLGDGGGGVGAASVVVDTVFEVEVPAGSTQQARFLAANGTLTALVGVVRNGTDARLPLDGNATVEVSVDGGLWKDARNFTGVHLRLQSGSADRLVCVVSAAGWALADGLHTLGARARTEAFEVDDTPVYYEFLVDTVSPGITGVVVPPPVSAETADTALFAFRCSESPSTVQWLCLASNASAVSGAPGVPCGMVPVGTDLVAAAHSTGQPWSTAAHESYGVILTALSAGVEYLLTARCVDGAGNVGLPAVWTWRSAPCPSRASLSDVLISDVSLLAVQASTWAVVWNATTSATAPALPRFEVHVFAGEDTAATVVYTTITSGQRALLPDGLLLPAAWYTVRVRVAVPPGCASVVSVLAGSSVTTFVPGACPGEVRLASAPPVSSASLFGDFVFNSTCSVDWVEYSLDGSSFVPCGKQLRVGPLSSTQHVLLARAVDVAGVRGPVLRFEWSIAASGESTITLTNLPDGPHVLEVRVRARVRPQGWLFCLRFASSFWCPHASVTVYRVGMRARMDRPRTPPETWSAPLAQPSGVWTKRLPSPTRHCSRPRCLQAALPTSLLAAQVRAARQRAVV
jgi:hypothetical protein